jgi:uncharacterized protein (TIGR03437 family)
MTSFGEGIGPAQGAHPSVTMASGYPSELAGVQVTFAGQPAPILYAQSGQINVVAPWSLTPGQPASVCVTYNKASTNCLAEQVAEAAPAIFMADSTYALAVNQDGTINSAANPARPGAYVSLYGTGFGPLNPRPKDGQLIEFPLPVNLLTTTVQTTILSFGPEITIYYHVEYAGPAPYQVAGLTQINVQAASGMSNVTAAVTDAAGNPFTSNTFAIHVAGE